MPKYYVNKKGKHQVHKEGCSGLAGYYDRRVIGVYENGLHAFKEALKMIPNARACKNCSPECFNEEVLNI